MDHPADRLLLTEAALGGVGERIDAVQGPIRVRFHRHFKRRGHRWVGGLLEKAPEGVRVNHSVSSIIPARPVSLRPAPDLPASGRRTVLYIGRLRTRDRADRDV